MKELYITLRKDLTLARSGLPRESCQCPPFNTLKPPLKKKKPVIFKTPVKQKETFYIFPKFTNLHQEETYLRVLLGAGVRREPGGQP